VCHSVRRGKCFSEWGLHPEFQLLNRRNNSADDWFYPWCSSLSRGRLVTSRAWLCQDCCGVATETQAGCGSCWDSPTIIGWTSRDTKKTYQNLKQPWARSGKNRTVQLLQDHMYINMYIYTQYIYITPYIYNTLYIYNTKWEQKSLTYHLQSTNVYSAWQHKQSWDMLVAMGGNIPQCHDGDVQLDVGIRCKVLPYWFWWHSSHVPRLHACGSAFKCRRRRRDEFMHQCCVE
jgi:hypothetical protein